jgi:pimeloyl-ACP methyl ester carboxylesterase
MVTIYKPDIGHRNCISPSFVEYMPAKAAAVFDEAKADILPNGTLESLQLRSCETVTTPSGFWEQVPLLLFSPGLTESRLMYGAILAAVASSGFTVIGVDHTYAPNAVEFPDGELAIGNQAQRFNGSAPDAVYKAMQSMMPVQAADLNNVLEAAQAGQLPGLPQYTDELKVGIFGHSLGAALAAYVLANDTRYVSGVNYDGPLSRETGNPGFNKPYLALGEEYLLTGNDTSWDDLWSHLTGWKSEFAINGTQHETFMDMPFVAKTLNLRERMNATEYDTKYGRIDGGRAFEVLWRYTTRFFAFTMKGARPEFLQSNSDLYPEAILLQGVYQ